MHPQSGGHVALTIERLVTVFPLINPDRLDNFFTRENNHHDVAVIIQRATRDNLVEQTVLGLNFHDAPIRGAKISRNDERAVAVTMSLPHRMSRGAQTIDFPELDVGRKSNLVVVEHGAKMTAPSQIVNGKR